MLNMCAEILVRDKDQPSKGPVADAPKHNIDLCIKFRNYIEKEEIQLDMKLKKARYDLDSVDSVRLGSGQRIEKV
jgi:hypothetical protein